MLSLLGVALAGCSTPAQNAANPRWNQNAYTAISTRPPAASAGERANITWRDAPYFGQPQNGPTPNSQVASYRAPAASPPPLAPQSRPATPTSAVRPAQLIRPTQHTVVQGDNLYRISQRYGISLPVLKQANGLADDMIYPGQQLRIP